MWGKDLVLAAMVTAHGMRANEGSPISVVF